MAIDTLAVRWVNEQRPRIRIAPIKDEVSYLEAASEAGLGVSDPGQIQVQDVKIDR